MKASTPAGASGIAVFDARPFFAKALAYGVQHRLLDAAKLATMRAEAPKGMVQIARYFGTEYLRPELRDPVMFAVSDYGRLLAQSETYRQTFRAPVQMYFGSHDEVVKQMIGVLMAAYQAVLIGNWSDQSENTVHPINVKGGTHRLTFITAAPAAKAWMDSLRKP